MTVESRSRSGPEAKAPPEAGSAAAPTRNLHRQNVPGNRRDAHAFDGAAPAAEADDGEAPEPPAACALGGGASALEDLEPAQAAMQVAADSRWPDPIDEAAFHGLAGDIVRAIEPHTEADPVALLTQFLAAFGSVAGKASYYEVEGAQHPARYYVVNVGSSSKARKGTTWRHVKRLFHALDDDEHVRHWLENRIVSGLSSGEGLKYQVRDPVEKQEPVREGGRQSGRIVDYETVVADPGVKDKRLLVVEGEYASVLQVMSRSGNTLSTTVRDAWDDGDLRTLTKNDPLKATGAHVCMIGHVTRDELLRYLDSTEQGNGFANRFMWFAVRRSKVLPEGGGCVAFDGLVPRLKKSIEYAAQVGKLAFDEEARAIWCLVYPKLSDGKPGLLGAMTARAEAQVMRLAVAYALLDCASKIQVDHLMAALAVWEYAEASVAWIFGDATGDSVADRIVKALEAAPDHVMTRTQIRDLFGRHEKSGRIDVALAALQSAKKIEVRLDMETGGRPRELMRLLIVRGKRGKRGKPVDTAHMSLSAQEGER